MVTIALCDSHPQLLSQYTSWIEYWGKKANTLYNIRTFTTTSQLLAHFLRVSDLDILIIDPSLDNGNGVNTVKKLRDLHCNAEVIYLAPSDKYLTKAFEAGLLFYHKKTDITLDVFGKFFMKAIANRKTYWENKVFSIRAGHMIKRVSYNSILYFEITRRVVTLHYGDNQTFEFYSTISALEDQLRDGNFLRTHRAIIVNLLCIESASNTSVTLFNGETLPVGITYSKLLLNSLSPSPLLDTVAL